MVMVITCFPEGHGHSELVILIEAHIVRRDISPLPPYPWSRSLVPAHGGFVGSEFFFSRRSVTFLGRGSHILGHRTDVTPNPPVLCLPKMADYWRRPQEKEGIQKTPSD